MAQGITYVATDSYNTFQEFCREHGLSAHHPGRSTSARRVSSYASFRAVTGGSLVILPSFSGNIDALKIMAQRHAVHLADYAVAES